MYLVLFVVGLLVTAAGFLTIGFGIPINAFSLGNTLIVAGTVAVVGGLVLIGLASVVRQLGRVAEALGARPVARPAQAVDTSDSLVPPTVPAAHVPVRAPVPPKPVEAAMPRPPEPRPAAEPRTPAAPSEAPGPLDWLRNKPRTSAGAPPPAATESPVVEVPDEAPLSPRVPQRPLFTPPPLSPSASEPPFEPRAWSPGRSSSTPELKESKFDVPPAPVPRSEQIARVTPASERVRDAAKPVAKDAGLFDVVWPDARSKAMAEPKREPQSPPPPQRPREESRSEGRPEPSSSERPAAILKSGVIDGMAYTLYVDGSIEAELPQGVVKFASVDALRAHLEKSA